MLFNHVVYGVSKTRGVGRHFFLNGRYRTFGEITLKKRNVKCYNKKRRENGGSKCIKQIKQDME